MTNSRAIRLSSTVHWHRYFRILVCARWPPTKTMDIWRSLGIALATPPTLPFGSNISGFHVQAPTTQHYHNPKQGQHTEGRPGCEPHVRCATTQSSTSTFPLLSFHGFLVFHPKSFRPYLRRISLQALPGLQFDHTTTTTPIPSSKHRCRCSRWSSQPRWER